MSATLVSVIIQAAVTQTALPAGISAGNVSAVVTDSTGAAQPAVTLTGSESPPFSLTTSLPVSADGITVSASVVYTSLDSTGTAIVATGNPSASIALTLTEPAFPLATGATMTLTPAAAAANPAIAAAAKKAK
jgi:hypothetical protein